MLHDLQDKQPLVPVVDPGNQAIFVAADMERRPAANLIGASKIGPEFGEVPPFCLPDDLEPVRQRRDGISDDLGYRMCGIRRLDGGAGRDRTDE